MTDSLSCHITCIKLSNTITARDKLSFKALFHVTAALVRLTISCQTLSCQLTYILQSCQ